MWEIVGLGGPRVAHVLAIPAQGSRLIDNFSLSYHVSPAHAERAPEHAAQTSGAASRPHV